MPNPPRKAPIVLMLVAVLAAVTASRADALDDARAAAAAFETSRNCRVGLVVADVKTGRTLISRRPDESFLPASNQKLLTSAFALTRLGETFQFATRFYLRADGDLLIFGDFDPTLADPVVADKLDKDIYFRLDAAAESIHKRLETPSLRNVLALTTAGPGVYRHADWPENQHERWYAAPVSLLSIHNNCWGVRWRKSGLALVPDVLPASRHIRVSNRTRRGSRHLWGLRGNRDESVLSLTGTVSTASDEPFDVAMDNPPLIAARVFADRLQRAGVAVTGRARTLELTPELQKTLAAHDPLCRIVTPVSVALARANKRSLNMAAECLMLRAGDGSWRGSAKLMERTLTKEFDLDADALTVRDGSGFSKSNRVSPAAMVKVLRGALGRAWSDLLLKSLPVGGKDGTLRKRMNRVEGRVIAKTGYVARTSCLSGYILDEQGEAALAFSILCNDLPPGKSWEAKKMQDDVCRRLVEWLE